MMIKQNPDGAFVVYHGTKEERQIAGPFPTNADAWRWIDRYTGDPVSKAEERGEWSFAKSAGGRGL